MRGRMGWLSLLLWMISGLALAADAAPRFLWERALDSPATVIDGALDSRGRLVSAYTQDDGIRVVVLGSDGATVAEQAFAQPGISFTYSGMALDDSNVYLTGTGFGEEGDRGAFLAALKLPELTLEWTQWVKRDDVDALQPFALVASSGNGVHILALSTLWGVNHGLDKDITFLQVLKFDSTGALLWNATREVDGSKFNDQGARDSLRVDRQGHVYAALCDVLVKLSPEGQELWSRSEEISALVLDSADHVVATTAMRGGFLGIGMKSRTIRVDPSGDRLWETAKGGFSLTPRQDGSVCVTGPRLGWLGRTDYDSACLDSKGKMLWSRTYDASKHDFPAYIAADAQGQITVIGVVQIEQGQSGNSVLPAYDLVKYDSAGRQRWTLRLASTNPARPSVFLPGDGRMFVTTDAGIYGYGL